MDKAVFSAHGPLVYLSNFLQKFLVCLFCNEVISGTFISPEDLVREEFLSKLRRFSSITDVGLMGFQFFIGGWSKDFSGSWLFSFLLGQLTWKLVLIRVIMKREKNWRKAINTWMHVHAQIQTHTHTFTHTQSTIERERDGTFIFVLEAKYYLSDNWQTS